MALAEWSRTADPPELGSGQGTQSCAPFASSSASRCGSLRNSNWKLSYFQARCTAKDLRAPKAWLCPAAFLDYSQPYLLPPSSHTAQEDWGVCTSHVSLVPRLCALTHNPSPLSLPAPTFQAGVRNTCPPGIKSSQQPAGDTLFNPILKMEVCLSQVPPPS